MDVIQKVPEGTMGPACGVLQPGGSLRTGAVPHSPWVSHKVLGCGIKCLALELSLGLETELCLVS